MSAFFSADSKRIFSVAQNGTLLLWKWTPNRSEEADKVIKYQEFKMGKRLKLGQDKPNAYAVTDDDVELMTELEREAATGRFLLEKRSRF